MNNHLYIPKKITTGYNARNDTYTGQLAYVIYTDDKGVLRKETSWQNWRNKNLGSDEFDNIPTSGFVLNRGVGGNRMSYGWNARNEYVRVWDPRNFEFEISLNNLLFILQESSSIKGKGLEGEFVYAWNGTELTLLPVDCQEYKECQKHTERQAIKFDKKDIKPGLSYIMKDGTEVLYLGHHLYNDSGSYSNRFSCLGKKHIFVKLNKDKYNNYIIQNGFTKIAECTSQSVLSQYPDELEEFQKSSYCGSIKEIEILKADGFTKKGDDWYKTLVTFFVKDGDEYIPIYESRMYSYDYWKPKVEHTYRYEYWYEDNKTKFAPIINKEILKVPKFCFNKRNIFNLDKDLFVIKITTIGGKELYI